MEGGEAIITLALILFKFSASSRYYNVTHTYAYSVCGCVNSSAICIRESDVWNAKKILPTDGRTTSRCSPDLRMLPENSLLLFCIFRKQALPLLRIVNLFFMPTHLCLSNIYICIRSYIHSFSTYSMRYFLLCILFALLALPYHAIICINTRGGLREVFTTLNCFTETRGVYLLYKFSRVCFLFLLSIAGVNIAPQPLL